jgi:hypothetical protein
MPELFAGGACGFADTPEVVVFEDDALEAGVLEAEPFAVEEADVVAPFEDVSVFCLAVFLAALESGWL